MSCCECEWACACFVYDNVTLTVNVGVNVNAFLLACCIELWCEDVSAVFFS